MNLSCLTSRIFPSLKFADYTPMAQFSMLLCFLSCPFGYNTCVENASLFQLDWKIREQLSIRNLNHVYVQCLGETPGKCGKWHPAEPSCPGTHTPQTSHRSVTTYEYERHPPTSVVTACFQFQRTLLLLHSHSQVEALPTLLPGT